MTTQPPDKPIDQVSVGTSLEFQRNIRTLKKRYRNIGKDIRPTLEQIQAGQLPGDQITGISFVVYKVRARNQDIQKGKSAGYRIIYQVESQDSVILIAIYSKSDRADMSIQAIKKIIAEISKADD